MKYFYLNFEKDRKTLKLAEENASAVEKELSPAGNFAIVSSENMTHGNCQNYALSAGMYKGDVYLCLLVHDGVARIFFENYFCESFNCCITYGNILYIERDSNADYR